ncbi:MAG TPA: hypothetical protein VMT35_02970 [Ignavibacteriaceae bacterium]|nr:hypothetical protein [Ignavibacteriaceae bacterium]
MKRLQQNKNAVLKFLGLLLLFLALVLSSCSKKDKGKMEAFSAEAFAYDLGNGWEVNASVFAKGFKQEKKGENYTALLSYDLDLIIPKGDTIKSLISRTEDKSNNEEMIDTQLEAQFNLDSTYAPGKYSVIFRIKDGLTDRSATAAANFEITKE